MYDLLPEQMCVYDLLPEQTCVCVYVVLPEQICVYDLLRTGFLIDLSSSPGMV